MGEGGVEVHTFLEDIFALIFCIFNKNIIFYNNTQQHNTTALGYRKLPMYQLFLWRLYLMVLRGATSLLGTLEGVGPENLDFFGPNGTRFACAISGTDVAPLKTINS